MCGWLDVVIASETGNLCKKSIDQSSPICELLDWYRKRVGGAREVPGTDEMKGEKKEKTY
jgi:hypothetical protein